MQNISGINATGVNSTAQHEAGLALLPIVLTYGSPAAVSATGLALMLYFVGWSVSRVESVLARSSHISNKSYARFVPFFMVLIRLACLVPLGLLVMLGYSIYNEPNEASLGVCVLMVGPSLLLLAWSMLRARHMRWSRTDPAVIIAAVLGLLGLLAAQFLLALDASTPFFSFSCVFLGLSALPVILIGALNLPVGAPPLLLLEAFSLSPAASADVAAAPTAAQASTTDGAPPPSIRKPLWMAMAFTTYALITGAYAGVGFLRRDVAPYAAAAAAACVLLFDCLALVLRRRGAVPSAAALAALCGGQRLVIVAFGPDYIDEGEAVVFLLYSCVLVHVIVRSRWVPAPADSLDLWLRELDLHDAKAAAGAAANAPCGGLVAKLTATVYARAREATLAGMIAVHLVLLLLLLELLPPGMHLPHSSPHLPGSADISKYLRPNRASPS